MTPRLVTPVSERDHILGPESASVTLLEYGDFECPSCLEAYPVVAALQQEMGPDLRFVFRHFPMTSVHLHAQNAAEAAEAASAQGRFWEMHGMLFEHQSDLEDRDLLGYAVALGLDARRFATELGAHKYAGRVRDDFMSGVRSGVNGTPTFYINEMRHDGLPDLRSLRHALDFAMGGFRRGPLRSRRGRGRVWY